MKRLRTFFFILFLFGLSKHGWSSTGHDPETLVNHVKQSIENGEKYLSNLPYGPSGIHGKLGMAYRHFLNNLCSLPEASYLEIGCWKGASLISSLCGNKETVRHAVAIDSFIGHEGAKRIFNRNVQAYLPSYPLRFYEINCFEANLSAFFPLPVNVYFYDGDHSAEAQEKAFTYFNPVFADTFIAVVDDWNWERVQEGTRSAFEKLGYKILFEKEIFTIYPEEEGWWNGVYIAVLQKPQELLNPELEEMLQQ